MSHELRRVFELEDLHQIFAHPYFASSGFEVQLTSESGTIYRITLPAGDPKITPFGKITYWVRAAKVAVNGGVSEYDELGFSLGNKTPLLLSSEDTLQKTYRPERSTAIKLVQIALS